MAEPGAWPFCIPLGTDVLRYIPQRLLLAANPARRPLVLGPLSRAHRTPPGPSLLLCDGVRKGGQRAPGVPGYYGVPAGTKHSWWVLGNQSQKYPSLQAFWTRERGRVCARVK